VIFREPETLVIKRLGNFAYITSAALVEFKFTRGVVNYSIATFDFQWMIHLPDNLSQKEA